MNRKKKVASPRAARRESERKLERLSLDRERLASYEKGGAPERPIEVESASEVEVIARGVRCVHCATVVGVEEHLAETISGQRLRIARVRCPACGGRRSIYFRLSAGLLN